LLVAAQKRIEGRTRPLSGAQDEILIGLVPGLRRVRHRGTGRFSHGLGQQNDTHGFTQKDTLDAAQVRPWLRPGARYDLEVSTRRRRVMGSYRRSTTRSFSGMMALSVMVISSGQTLVQHLVMLQ